MFQKVCDQLRVPQELVQYFSLFVMGINESGPSHCKKILIFIQPLYDDIYNHYYFSNSGALLARLRVSSDYSQTSDWAEQNCYSQEVRYFNLKFEYAMFRLTTLMQLQLLGSSH